MYLFDEFLYHRRDIKRRDEEECLKPDLFRKMHFADQNGLLAVVALPLG